MAVVGRVVAVEAAGGGGGGTSSHKRPTADDGPIVNIAALRAYGVLWS